MLQRGWESDEEGAEIEMMSGSQLEWYKAFIFILEVN